jgi:hypothetical protein
MEKELAILSDAPEELLLATNKLDNYPNILKFENEFWNIGKTILNDVGMYKRVLLNPFNGENPYSLYFLNEKTNAQTGLYLSKTFEDGTVLFHMLVGTLNLKSEKIDCVISSRIGGPAFLNKLNYGNPFPLKGLINKITSPFYQNPCIVKTLEMDLDGNNENIDKIYSYFDEEFLTVEEFKEMVIKK